MMSKITIYMPNYNYGKFISKSINSVIRQTYKEWELLVIDDGSKDNSLSLLKKFKKNKKIKIISQTNKGLNRTNNIALRLSETDYIVRLDPDDYLDENFLNVTISYLEKNKKIDLVYPDYYTIDKNNKIINLIRYSDSKFSESLNDLPPHGACTVFRRKTLISLGGYDESVRRQDGYDIWLKFIKRYQAHNIKIPLFYYRRHENNSTNNKKKILEAKSTIVKNHTNELLKNIKTLALIPVSSETLYKYNSPFTKFCGKPLIWYTLFAATNSKNLNKIVLNTRDTKVINYVKKNFPNISILRRKKTYSNAKDLDLLKDTIDNNKSFKSYDFYAVLYINTPLRKNIHIDHAISLASLFKTDKIVSVSEETAQFYFHDKKGLKKINNKSNMIRLERDSIYKENGSVFIYNQKAIYNKDKDSDDISIGHLQMLQEESVKINSLFEFKLAEFLFKNNDKY